MRTEKRERVSRVISLRGKKKKKKSVLGSCFLSLITQAVKQVELIT